MIFFLFILSLFSYSFALWSELNTSTSNENMKIGVYIDNMWQNTNIWKKKSCSQKFYFLWVFPFNSIIRIHSIVKQEVCLRQTKTVFHLSVVTEDLQFSLHSMGFTLLSGTVNSGDCLMWCGHVSSMPLPGVWKKDRICWPTSKI